MVSSVKLRIEGYAVDDPWPRYYGVSVDEALDMRFWETQPGKVRKVVSQQFTDELEVPDTTQYIVVGVSAWVGYWTIRVYRDGSLIGESNCAVPDAYPGSPGYPRFSVALVTPPIPTPVPTIPSIPWWVLPLGLGLTALMVAGGVVLYNEVRRRQGSA